MRTENLFIKSNMIMNRFSWLLLLFLTIMAFANSCDLYEQDSYEETYMVESYLDTGEPLTKVRLSTTSQATSTYRFEDLAVDSAGVQVHRIDGNGSILQTTRYHQPDTGSGGIYYPIPAENQVAEPLAQFRLEITIPETGHEISAETAVPDAFSILESARDTLVYQSTEQLETVISPIENPYQDQSHFIFTILAENPQYEALTPFYRDQVDDSDETTIEDFTINNSGIVNEGNFTLNNDGTITLKLPWIGFAFYGPNKLVTSTIDKNTYDFIRSQSVQTGGSTLSPGEIQNAIYHVEGGIGIFGSISSDTISTFLVPPAFPEGS